MRKHPGSNKLLRGVIGLGLVLALAACGDDDDDGAVSGTGTGATEPTGTGATEPTGTEAPEPTGTEAPEPTGTEAPEPTATEAPATEEPYSITVAMENDVTSLDPQKIQDVPARVVYGNIFEPLLRRTPDGRELEPVLAAELPELIDDTTWEVKLRDDVTFSSGKPFTADDVVYTFDRLFDPALESEQADLLNTIATTTAVDPTTVRFTTTAPDPILPSRLAYALILPEGQGEVPGFPEEGLDGTGAYVFDHRTPEVEVLITKRDDYWGDAAGAPAEMLYKVVPDPATRLASLQAEEVDIIFSIPPEQVDQVPQAKPVLSTETGLLRTNTLIPPFDNVELRRAANMAIDRETIVETLFNGEAGVSKCHIAAPPVFGHSAGMAPPPYDPETASQLVAEHYNGETITMYGAGRFAKLMEVAQVVAQQLQEVGFTVDLQFPTNQDVLIEQFSGDKSKYVGLMLYQSSAELFDEAQQLQWITSDGIYSAITNPEADQLALEATTQLDPAARQEAYDQLNQLMCDDALNVYLYYAPDIYGLSSRIDWTPRSDAQVILTDVRVQS